MAVEGIAKDAVEASSAGMENSPRKFEMPGTQDVTETAETRPEGFDARDIKENLGDVSDNSLRKMEEAPTRELTGEERNYYTEKLGWTDKQLDKCTIGDDGVIQFKTINCDMEGQTDKNGVSYERKVVEIDGVKVEGVFPKFDSKLDVQLPKELEKSDNIKQFKECNNQLQNAIERDPGLGEQFTERQMEQIKDGKTPEGYVWHHNEGQGKMQMVEAKKHNPALGGAPHTGGKTLWGGGY